MTKKYELTDIKKEIKGSWDTDMCLHRIRALKNFGDVKAGDLGGWVESERNLSQEGDCWIYDDAIACEFSRIAENAKMYNKSKAFDWGRMLKESKMFNESKIEGHGLMDEYSEMHGASVLTNWARLAGSSKMFGKSICQGFNFLNGGSILLSDD